MLIPPGYHDYDTLVFPETSVPTREVDWFELTLGLPRNRHAERWVGGHSAYYRPVAVAAGDDSWAHRLDQEGLDMLRHERCTEYIEGFEAFCCPYNGKKLHHVLDRHEGDDLTYEVNWGKLHEAAAHYLLGSNDIEQVHLRWTDPVLRAAMSANDSAEFPLFTLVDAVFAVDLRITDLPPTATTLAIIDDNDLAYGYWEPTEAEIRRMETEAESLSRRPRPRPVRPTPREPFPSSASQRVPGPRPGQPRPLIPPRRNSDTEPAS